MKDVGVRTIATTRMILISMIKQKISAISAQKMKKRQPSHLLLRTTRQTVTQNARLLLREMMKTEHGMQNLSNLPSAFSEKATISRLKGSTPHPAAYSVKRRTSTLEQTFVILEKQMKAMLLLRLSAKISAISYEQIHLSWMKTMFKM